MLLEPCSELCPFAIFQEVNYFHYVNNLFSLSSRMIFGADLPASTNIFLPLRYICNCRERTTAVSVGSVSICSRIARYSPSGENSFRCRWLHILMVSIVILRFVRSQTKLWASGSIRSDVYSDSPDGTRRRDGTPAKAPPPPPTATNSHAAPGGRPR